MLESRVVERTAYSRCRPAHARSVLVRIGPREAVPFPDPPCPERHTRRERSVTVAPSPALPYGCGSQWCRSFIASAGRRQD